MKKITVLTPTYNDSESIKETLTSLLNQSYTNWESIIIDDGSTDNTKSIIENFKKENNLENKPIKFSLDKYSKDAIISLQNKKVIIINIKKKEYALTQWYSSICNEGDNEVTIFIDDIVFEYLKLYVLNK